MNLTVKYSTRSYDVYLSRLYFFLIHKKIHIDGLTNSEVIVAKGHSIYKVIEVIWDWNPPHNTYCLPKIQNFIGFTTLKVTVFPRLNLILLVTEYANFVMECIFTFCITFIIRYIVNWISIYLLLVQLRCFLIKSDIKSFINTIWNISVWSVIVI